MNSVFESSPNQTQKNDESKILNKLQTRFIDSDSPARELKFENH